VPASQSDKKKKLGIIIGLCALCLIALIILIVKLTGGNDDKRNSQIIEEIQTAMNSNKKKIHYNKEDLTTILNQYKDISESPYRVEYRYALIHAHADENANYDADTFIAEFATTSEMTKGARRGFFSDVIKHRKSEAAAKVLLDFASKNLSNEEGVAAVQSLEKTPPKDIEGLHNKLVNILSLTTSDAQITACTKTLQNIILNSENKNAISSTLIDQYPLANSPKSKSSMIALLGYTSADSSKQIITEALSDDQEVVSKAASKAFGEWENLSVLPMIMKQITNINPSPADKNLKQKNIRKRDELFISASKLLTKINDESQAKENWTHLVEAASNFGERDTIIKGVLNLNEAWGVAVLNTLIEDSQQDNDTQSVSRAGTAINKLKKVR